MRATVDPSKRRELVAQLLSMEPAANAPSAAGKAANGYENVPCCSSGCANDGCCSSTCAWTWVPFKG